MLVSVDLHVHSRRSFDGLMTPRQIVAAGRRRGLAGLAVVDHNTLAGAVEVLAAAPPDLLIIPGAEIYTEIGDIVGLFLTREIVARRSDKVVAEIHEQGGVAVLPHPYRYHGKLERGLLERLDAVETHNGRAPAGDAERALRELALSYGLAAVGGSDAHLPWEVGRARTELEVDAVDAASVRAALMRGACTGVGGRRSDLAILISKSVKHLRRLIG
jgi:predicted metal-dependent phosphoesterase TrpH